MRQGRGERYIMPGVPKTYENYYFEDTSLLFDPDRPLRDTVRYGALVKMREAKIVIEGDTHDWGYTARWKGLPIAPLTYHPAEPATVDRLTEKRRTALAQVLASTQGQMERIPEDLDTAAT